MHLTSAQLHNWSLLLILSFNYNVCHRINRSGLGPVTDPSRLSHSHQSISDPVLAIPGMSTIIDVGAGNLCYQLLLSRTLGYWCNSNFLEEIPARSGIGLFLSVECEQARIASHVEEIALFLATLADEKSGMSGFLEVHLLAVIGVFLQVYTGAPITLSASVHQVSCAQSSLPL